METTPYSESLVRVRSALERALFGQGAPTVVALKGGWGEGKTRFWKDTFAGRADNAPGYVSVFGAESLATIQKAVIAESLRTRPRNAISGGLYKAIEKTYPFRDSAKAIFNAIDPLRPVVNLRRSALE